MLTKGAWSEPGKGDPATYVTQPSIVGWAPGIPHNSGDTIRNSCLGEREENAPARVRLACAGAPGLPHHVTHFLMPNHMHLIAVPEPADGLPRARGGAHRRYPRRVNCREGGLDHCWQGRFAS